MRQPINKLIIRNTLIVVEPFHIEFEFKNLKIYPVPAFIILKFLLESKSEARNKMNFLYIH